jgi:hypothetical protein
MVRLCHFEVLGGRWQRDIGRGAVLGRAVSTSQAAPGANTLTRAMHEHGLLDYQFRRQLEIADAAAPSAIKFTGDVRAFDIKSADYVPNFPLHAHKPDPETALGHRDWKVVSKD